MKRARSLVLLGFTFFSFVGVSHGALLEKPARVTSPLHYKSMRHCFVGQVIKKRDPTIHPQEALQGLNCFYFGVGEFEAPASAVYQPEGRFSVEMFSEADPLIVNSSFGEFTNDFPIYRELTEGHYRWSCVKNADQWAQKPIWRSINSFALVDPSVFVQVTNKLEIDKKQSRSGGRDCGVSLAQGRIGSLAGGLVRPHENKSLDGRDESQNASKASKDLRVISDRLGRDILDCFILGLLCGCVLARLFWF